MSKKYFFLPYLYFRIDNPFYLCYNESMKKTIPVIRPSKELSTIAHDKGCPAHYHENCEFLFQISGTGETLINDMKAQLSAGDILFINDRVSHTLIKTNEKYRHRDVYISSTRLKELCDTFFDANFYHYLMSTKRIVSIPMEFSVFSSYAKRLQKLQTLTSLYPQKKSSFKKSILTIIISLLGILYENRQNEPDEKESWLQDFLITINTPEMFTKQIKDLVKDSHYSYTYFSHIFKDTYHQTFKSYLETLRITYAKSLLTDPDSNIVDIALLCGYSSQSHFTQAFKKVTGLTPKEYQKKKTSIDK